MNKSSLVSFFYFLLFTDHCDVPQKKYSCQSFFTASPVNHYEQLSLSEITNNTNLIPEILNHTSQLVGLWAQLRIMTDKLDKIQDELDNCSHEVRYGHLTAATPSTAPPSEWQLHYGL